MPQENCVLRCYSCETFQVHIVKKAKNWVCKLCGAKQSLKRIYGKGSGKDCRNQVMKLNELRMLKSNNAKHVQYDLCEETIVNESKGENLNEKNPSISKWTEYLEKNNIDDESDVENDDDTTNCLSEIVHKNKKRMKKIPKSSCNSSKKICRDFKMSNHSFESESFDDMKYMFSTPISKQTFESSKISEMDSQKPYLKETKIEKDYRKEHSNNRKNVFKHSKYSKFMDDDGVDTNDDDDDDDNGGSIDLMQLKKNSNIFESESIDLDSIFKL